MVPVGKLYLEYMQIAKNNGVIIYEYAKIPNDVLYKNDVTLLIVILKKIILS